MLLSLSLNLVITLGIFILALYFISLLTKRNDIADLGWGGGFLIIITTLLATTENQSPTVMLLTLLITLWAFRIMLHTMHRHMYQAGEGFRHCQWRADLKNKWGGFHLHNFFQVFVWQGVLMLLVSSSTVVIFLYSQNTLNWLAYLATALWAFGFFWEAVGDYQLHRFKEQPANEGKIMQSGLWQYSRHPHYFGELVMWWSIFIFGVAVLPVVYLPVTLISPLVISYLLLFVSGVPVIEARFAGNTEFAEYKKRVNAIVPEFYKRWLSKIG